jgi:general secretion pathway protein D
MKTILLMSTLLLTLSAQAADKIKFDYKYNELRTIISDYSKASGKKIIIDSSLYGSVSILNPSEITIEDAYNQLSEALSINGYAIVTNGDQLTIKNARSAQRDNLAVVTELPTEKPQRLVTWVIDLKNSSAGQVMRELRMLTSYYGEISINSKTNQLIITDWTSNLQRVKALLQKIDVPADPKVAKFAEFNKKISEEKREIKKTVKIKNGKVEEKTETETESK